MIISASRRCDIPSHFGEWFVNRLKEGYALVQNPYNAGRLSRVSLTSDSVDIMVFWTKNPLPFLKHLPEIDSFEIPYYFEFTLTPYGRETEKNLPDKERLIEAFIELSEKLGKHRMVWRYDPIIIDQSYTLDYHKERFYYMADRLSPYSSRCVISFVDNYKSVMSRMGRDPSLGMTSFAIDSISEMLSSVGKRHSLDIYTCAEHYDLGRFGIKNGACVDKDIIEGILGCKIDGKKDKNQRPECLCLESVDIGGYNCCANGCSYCYAVKSEGSAAANMKRHNVHSPVMIGEVSSSALITGRTAKSVAIKQVSLFDVD